MKTSAKSTKLKPSDLIRAERLLKLIDEYKEYDARQKAYITQLETENKRLTRLTSEIGVQELRDQISSLNKKICEQRKHIQILQYRYKRLTAILNSDEETD